MAASCCSTALFSFSRPNTSYGVVSSSSVSLSLPQQTHRFGLSFRAQRRLEARKSVRVSCIGDNKTAAVTGKSWDKLVLDSETPVLVEFYASWCGPSVPVVMLFKNGVKLESIVGTMPKEFYVAAIERVLAS
ncbi:hypothetical protein DH2020_030543 [Rehmannia glutinosa]|uniref:Thioredoxin domain-containing protein n=1 Tax=Rehmannia glutinosa TaxID=99300 RepID=A0ABR0VNM9_REHGL